MTTVTREKLYEQVWARPMTKVAAEYGLTSTGLKKTCKRYEIPTPPRGYWQQLAHGKTLPKTPLPKASSPATAITISGDARPRLNTAVQQGEAALAATIEMNAAMSNVTEAAALLATRRAFKKARPDSQGFCTVGGRGLLGLRLAPEHLERALQVASRLIAISANNGNGIAAVENGLALEINGTNVAFRIEEEGHAEPHTPTPAEMKRAQENARWGGSSTPWPKYDYSPSGRLAVAIDANPYSGLRRNYADRKKQKLEDMLIKILQGFADHAAYATEQKRLGAERARAHAEAEARRQRRQAFEAREKRRWEMVDAIHSVNRRAKLTPDRHPTLTPVGE